MSVVTASEYKDCGSPEMSCGLCEAAFSFRVLHISCPLFILIVSCCVFLSVVLVLIRLSRSYDALNRVLGAKTAISPEHHYYFVAVFVLYMGTVIRNLSVSKEDNVYFVLRAIIDCGGQAFILIYVVCLWMQINSKSRYYKMYFLVSSGISILLGGLLLAFELTTESDSSASPTDIFWIVYDCGFSVLFLAIFVRLWIAKRSRDCILNGQIQSDRSLSLVRPLPNIHLFSALYLAGVFICFAVGDVVKTFELDFGFCVWIVALSLYYPFYPQVIFALFAADARDMSSFSIYGNEYIDDEQTPLLNPGSQGNVNSVVVSHSLRSDPRSPQDFRRRSLADAPVARIPLLDLEFEGIIASGSFGTVHKARWESIDVAVKVLKMPSDEIERGSAVHKFCGEMLVMSSLRHPNVLPLYGYSDDSMQLAIVTKYMSGGSLQKALSSPGGYARLTPPVIFKLAVQVAKALLYLHSNDPPILHRDLKPANILLDNDWNVCVGDFGLARVAPAANRYATCPSGTLQWMAPEVIVEPSSFSEKSDVYSYGVVLWELVMHRPPFEHIDLNSLALGLFDGSLRLNVPPWEERKDAFLHPDFHRLLSLCLDDNPDSRPNFSQVLSILASIESSLRGVVSARRSASSSSTARGQPVASSSSVSPPLSPPLSPPP